MLWTPNSIFITSHPCHCPTTSGSWWFLTTIAAEASILPRSWTSCSVVAVAAVRTCQKWPALDASGAVAVSFADHICHHDFTSCYLYPDDSWHSHHPGLLSQGSLSPHNDYRSSLALCFSALLRNFKHTDFQRLGWYCMRVTTQDYTWTYLVYVNQSLFKKWAQAHQIRIPSSNIYVIVVPKVLHQAPNIFSHSQV